MGLFTLGEKPKNTSEFEQVLHIQILAYFSRKGIIQDFELIESPNLLEGGAEQIMSKQETGTVKAPKEFL